MEEHFRKKLKNHKVDWDKEELLGSLEQELSQKKSRFDWKFFLLLPLLFIATCWGLTESKFATTDYTAMLTRSTSKSNVTNTPIKTKPNSTFNNAKKSLSNKEENKHESLTNNNISTSTSFSNSTKNNASFFSNKKELILKNPITQNLKLTTQNTKLNINSTPPVAAITRGQTSSSKKENQERLILPRLLPHLETPMLSFERQVDSQLPTLTMNPLESNLQKKTPPFKNSFFVSSSIETGAVIHQNTNYATNDLEFLELLINNEKTESYRFLLSSNLSIGYLDQSGWSLQSGLEYNEIMGFFNYKYFRTDTLPAYNEAGLYFVNSNADTLFFGDSTSLIRTEETTIKHWNKQPYFSIPLEVGYRRAFGRTNIFGMVGINYAFAYKFKGRVNQLNEDGTSEIVNNPDFTLKNRIGYRLRLGTEIPLFKRTHLLMNISYLRNPKLAGASKEQFYQSISSGVGLRFSFD